MKILKILKKTGPVAAIVVISLLLFILIDVLQVNNYTRSWIFLNWRNILNILYQVSVNAIMAFAMTQVIIINGIDLSVGSIISLAGVVLCMLMMNFSVPLLPALMVTLLLGSAIGLLSGFLIAKFEIPAFVITLGAMILIRGVSFILVDGDPVFNDMSSFLFIGNGTLLGIPFPIYILALMFGLFHYTLKYSKFGLHIYALGGNEESAKLSGVRVNLVKMGVFALSGFAASVSGIILASRLGSGQPLSGEGYELDVITAVIVGGASFTGGVGRMTGTLIGAIIIGLISNGMNLLNIQPYLQWVIKGSLILAVVVFKQGFGKDDMPHTHIVVEKTEPAAGAAATE
jgi:ribose transport system permease protein